MGRQFPLTSSTPVAISIILVRSQIDAGSLIQVEENEKALSRTQKKIMHAWSTLDWSQSNNISCSTVYNFILLTVVVFCGTYRVNEKD